ncbi:MAG: TPM domain-containing protein [Ruminococcaceae bacterium]|nr:TPM domain-containing protein [Oscillospiraceae bacterium]
MKKLLSISLVLLLIAALAVPAFAAEGKQYCVDNCGFLQEDALNEVENRLATLSDKLNMDFVVVTTDNLEGKTKTAYADDYYDYNGYGEGRQGDRSGVLLLVYKLSDGSTERWISTRGYGITAFTDYGIQYVGKQLVPLMDNGQWKEAFLLYADLSEDLVNRANEGKPLDSNNAPKQHNVLMGVVIALVVGLIVAFIVMSSIKKKYKPVTFKANATDYLVGGSLNVTGAYDNFRTTSVTRTAIQSNSGGGSSTHSSSSGASHGGGGF